MHTPIGGYFELELSCGEHYHNAALRLNSARSCIEYILRARDYHKVYIPYYTCEIVVQPFHLLHIDYEFYTLDNQLEPAILPELCDDEAFLYTNYFGLKQLCVERLAQHYGSRLIVDNAQAFFAPALPGVDTFYSPRKFFGVPDGGYLYCDAPLIGELPQAVSYDRMSHLLKRIDLGAEDGYQDFQNNDNTLAFQGIKAISKLTEALLSGVDYETVRKKRKENYHTLEEALESNNQLRLDMDSKCTPMVYPFLSNDASLKQKLIGNKIFVATYWPNVLEWCKPDNWEYLLAQKTCFLPVDQRYGKEDMAEIIETIKRV